MGGLDWFLILIAVLSGVGLLLRFRGLGGETGEATEEFAVYATWEGADARTVACLREGEVLYTAAGEVFGRVLDMEIEAMEVELIAGGEVYRLASQDRKRVELRLAVACRLSEGMLMRSGGEPLAVGQQIRLYGRSVSVPITVSHFDRSGISLCCEISRFCYGNL